jgi:predicted regulator of Ras-like GTPase activity (Roadblock/LC7/MglB family)
MMSLDAMQISNFRLGPELYGKIQSILDSLVARSRGILVSLVTRSGQELAFSGERLLIDRAALAALAASNLAASFGVAELIDEKEFERVYHKGKEKSILMVPIGTQLFLLIVFSNQSQNTDSLYAVKSAVVVLNDLLNQGMQK